MSNPPNAIIRGSTINWETKSLSVHLEIPFTRFPDEGDLLSEEQLSSIVDEEVKEWKEYVRDVLIDEPIRSEALWAVTGFAMQRLYQLGWEAAVDEDEKRGNFYYSFADELHEVRTQMSIECDDLTERYSHGLLELDATGRKSLAVHEHYIAATKARRINERAQRKPALRSLALYGQPLGLDDIKEDPEEEENGNEHENEHEQMDLEVMDGVEVDGERGTKREATDGVDEDEEGEEGGRRRRQRLE